MYNKNILIIIDVWEKWNQPAETSIISNLGNFIRSLDPNMWSIVVSNSGEGINSTIKNSLDEFGTYHSITDGIEQFTSRYDMKKPHNIFYAGFASNFCILHNAVGWYNIIKIAKDKLIQLVMDCSGAQISDEYWPQHYTQRTIALTDKNYNRYIPQEYHRYCLVHDISTMHGVSSNDIKR